jgi:alpha-L-fucosidase
VLLDNRADVPGDFVTPEQVQPKGWVEVDGQRVVWEACQTLNGSWGYDRDNLNWKSPDLLVRMLVDSVSKGGNLLLNVGPTARGELEPRAVATLDVIGRWLRQHGRAIYGCTASELTPPPDGRYTQRGDRLYLHLLDWPFRHVHLPGLGGKVAYAQLLHDGSEVQVAETQVSADDLTLTLPIQPPDVVVPVIELFLR